MSLFSLQILMHQISIANIQQRKYKEINKKEKLDVNRTSLHVAYTDCLHCSTLCLNAMQQYTER